MYFLLSTSLSWLLITKLFSNVAPNLIWNLGQLYNISDSKSQSLLSRIRQNWNLAFDSLECSFQYCLIRFGYRWWRLLFTSCRIELYLQCHLWRYLQTISSTNSYHSIYFSISTILIKCFQFYLRFPSQVELLTKSSRSLGCFQFDFTFDLGIRIDRCWLSLTMMKQLH